MAFVVATLDEEQHIEQCLNSILEQDYPPGRIEVAVVDGGSTDGTLEIVRRMAQRHPAVQLHHNPQRYASSAFNRGIAATQGDIVTLASAHSLLDPGYARRLVRAFEQSGAWLVGGVARASPATPTPTARAIAAAMSSPVGVGNAVFRYSGEQQWVDTAFPGAYRRALFDEIGLFDVALHHNQDDDLHFRARAAGHRMWFDPTLVTTYYARSSLGRLFEQYAGYGRWRAATINKHSAVASARHLAPPALVLAVALGAAPLPVGRSVRSAGLRVVLAAYSMVIAGGVGREWRRGVRGVDLFLLAPTLSVLHVAYGWGFWHGVVTEIARRRSAAGG